MVENQSIINMTRIDESEVRDHLVQQASTSCSMGPNFNFDSYSKCVNDEAVIHLKDLCQKDKDEVIEDMQDWEMYMFCKVGEESRKAVIEDLPPVRPSGETDPDNKILFRVTDEQSKTKDIAARGKSENVESDNECETGYLVPNFAPIVIRSRENWDDEMFKDTIGVRVEKAKIFKAKGNKAYEAKDYESACKLYTTCLSYAIDFVSIDAYNNRAQTHMKLGKFTAAISDLNRTLTADPKNKKALYRRALCRKETRMYREALKDLDNLSNYYPEDPAGKPLRAEIEKIVSTLTGKSHRLRENFDSRETFQVEESQLLVYAEEDREYLLEVDKTGCLKKCVCNHCTNEDRPSFQSNNRLRIERPKWKPLTLKLLEDIGISQKLSGSDDSGPKENGNISKATTVKNVCASAASANTAGSSSAPLLNGTDGPRSTAQYGAISSVPDEMEKSIRRRARTRPPGHSARMKQCIEMANQERALAAKEILAGLAMRSEDAKTGASRHPEKEKSDELSGTELTRSLNSVCKDFNLPEQWEQMSQHLRTLTSSKSFTIDIQAVDKRTLSDVSNVLKLAVDLKLESANELKELFTS